MGRCRLAGNRSRFKVTVWFLPPTIKRTIVLRAGVKGIVSRYRRVRRYQRQQALREAGLRIRRRSWMPPISSFCRHQQRDSVHPTLLSEFFQFSPGAGDAERRRSKT